MSEIKAMDIINSITKKEIFYSNPKDYEKHMWFVLLLLSYNDKLVAIINEINNKQLTAEQQYMCLYSVIPKGYRNIGYYPYNKQDDVTIKNIATVFSITYNEAIEYKSHISSDDINYINSLFCEQITRTRIN